jgi:hypothetical protein
MKTNIIIASAALSVLCGLYFVRLNDASLRNASESSLGPALPMQNEATSVTANTVTAASFTPAPIDATTLKTTRNEHTIRAERNATIECKRGTKVFFPANSFVDSEGAAITGKINLVIEECYNLEEMLAAKLSTTSGDKILETAGMIRVRAFSKRKEVFLREGVRYNIHFPVNNDRKEDFQLFYGERDENGVIDWKLETNSEPISEATGTARSIKNDCFIQINASELRCGTRIREMDYFNWPLSTGQNLNQWFVSNFNPSSEMVDDFCANRMYSQITFRVKPDGTFRDYYVSHTAREDYDRVITAAISSMPPLDMKKFMPVYSDDHACVLSFGRQQGRDSEAFKSSFVKRYYEDSTQKMTNVNTADLNYYIFSSAELGWINCDRFAVDQGPLVDVLIRSDASNTATVSMVFETERSILAGIKTSGGFTFKGVPANKNVRIVAIDNPNDSPVMEVSKINTSCKTHSLRNLQPITLADLDAALRWN